MKNQTLGVEIEFTGITRDKAAKIVSNYFRGNVERKYDGYDSYKIRDSKDREWTIMRDASIIPVKKVGNQIKNATREYSVELVTPILKYEEDIDILQELLRRIRKAGGISSSEYKCGIHIHIGANKHTPNTLKNIVNLMAAKEELIYKSLEISSDRVGYCKRVNENLLTLINKKKPKTFRELEEIWYRDYSDNRSRHYHQSRYHGLNLHSTFTKGTIEFRLFNGTMHAGKLRSYIVFCLAISHQALIQKTASAKRTRTDNEKYTFRCWLLRLGLIGDEFKNCRKHLMEHLDGNSAWRNG